MNEVNSKNKVLTNLAIGTVLLSIIVHILHRQFHIFGSIWLAALFMLGQIIIA